MNSGILLSAIIENVTTRRDNTIKITIGCQEISQGKAGELFGLHGKLAAIYVSPKNSIPQSDLDQIDAVDVDMPGKTQSQRLRSVLFILWEQQNEGFKDFQGYYRSKTEAIIQELKNNIL